MNSSTKSLYYTQGTGNTFKDLYAYHPNSSYSLPAQYYNPSTIDGLHHRNQSAKEENNKKGQEEKTTGGIDLVDIAYPILKKWKDRNDKFEEMRKYFADNSRTPFPSHFPLDIFNYGKLKNTLPYDVRSEFCSTPMPSSLSVPQVDKRQPKKVIGYVGVICSHCLESESLKVMYDPNTGNKYSELNISAILRT
jgi:hypothetical protein